MSNDNTSTLKSYVDSATGAAQSAIGSLTGNTSDQVRFQNISCLPIPPSLIPISNFPSTLTPPAQNKGEARKDKADLESDLSHSTVKAGPFTTTPSGVSKDSPDRTQGSWNQTVGSAKSAVGGLVGAEGLKAEGERQNQTGKEQEARGQLSDLSGGISDRVQGAVGGAVAGLTGDREAQTKFADIHDQGKAAQRGVEADLDKKVDP